MSKPAVEALRREPTHMRSALGIVRETLAAMEEGQAGDFILLANALYYMRKFPSLIHHPKEDAIFGRLVELDPAWKADVTRLREQHREIYRLEDWLIEATLDQPRPGTEARSRLIEFGRHYLQLQRQHSETEERVLFPQTLLSFKGPDWSMISSKFVDVDDPLFGEHSGERFHLLYDYLIREASNG